MAPSTTKSRTTISITFLFVVLASHHGQSLKPSLPSSLSRREWIGSIVIGFPTSCWAVDSLEFIRRGASFIPGYGPSDIFYPLQLTGRWNVTRENIEAQTYHYDMRFLPSTTTANACVQDRGYNLMKFESVSVDTNTTSSDASKSAILLYEWTEMSPNDVRFVFMDGSREEIKVTKRATEQTEDTVTSSEFLRISSEDSRGIPIIQARRVLTKWKIVSTNVVEGFEITYDMSGGNLGDPLGRRFITNPVTATAGPQIISKSRLHLVRILGDS